MVAIGSLGEALTGGPTSGLYEITGKYALANIEIASEENGLWIVVDLDSGQWWRYCDPGVSGTSPAFILRQTTAGILNTLKTAAYRVKDGVVEALYEDFVLKCALEDDNTQPSRVTSMEAYQGETFRAGSRVGGGVIDPGGVWISYNVHYGYDGTVTRTPGIDGAESLSMELPDRTGFLVSLPDADGNLHAYRTNLEGELTLLGDLDSSNDARVTKFGHTVLGTATSCVVIPEDGGKPQSFDMPCEGDISADGKAFYTGLDWYTADGKHYSHQEQAATLLTPFGNVVHAKFSAKGLQLWSVPVEQDDPPESGVPQNAFEWTAPCDNFNNNSTKCGDFSPVFEAYDNGLCGVVWIKVGEVYNGGLVFDCSDTRRNLQVDNLWIAPYDAPLARPHGITGKQGFYVDADLNLHAFFDERIATSQVYPRAAAPGGSLHRLLVIAEDGTFYRLDEPEDLPRLPFFD